MAGLSDMIDTVSSGGAQRSVFFTAIGEASGVRSGGEELRSPDVSRGAPQRVILQRATEEEVVHTLTNFEKKLQIPSENVKIEIITSWKPNSW